MDKDRGGVTADEAEELLNDLLSRWHDWARQFPYVAGYPTTSSGTEQFRASRQYDADNGAIDQDNENRLMNVLDACIERVRQPHRTALYINARNLSTGITVWRSARLPDDAMQRAHVVAEARGMLLHQLQSFAGWAK